VSGEFTATSGGRVGRIEASLESGHPAFHVHRDQRYDNPDNVNGVVDAVPGAETDQEVTDFPALAGTNAMKWDVCRAGAGRPGIFARFLVSGSRRTQEESVSRRLSGT
jgi:hypothetical protein